MNASRRSQWNSTRQAFFFKTQRAQESNINPREKKEIIRETRYLQEIIIKRKKHVLVAVFSSVPLSSHYRTSQITAFHRVSWDSSALFLCHHHHRWLWWSSLKIVCSRISRKNGPRSLREKRQRQ